MAELIVSPLAKADMREIGDHISRELRNPGAALRMLGRFQKAMFPLRDFPEIGAPLLVSGKQSVPYRYLVCGHYLIFSDRVLVDRVLYGRRNYTALLFGDLLEDEE